jgi:hypothetical protein
LPQRKKLQNQNENEQQHQWSAQNKKRKLGNNPIGSGLICGRMHILDHIRGLGPVIFKLNKESPTTGQRPSPQFGKSCGGELIGSIMKSCRVPTDRMRERVSTPQHTSLAIPLWTCVIDFRMDVHGKGWKRLQRKHWPIVYYETIKRNLNRRLVYECRCDERLKDKTDGSTRLTKHLVFYKGIPKKNVPEKPETRRNDPNLGLNLKIQLRPHDLTSDFKKWK